ncbi:MAG: hypothetical protein ACFB5Z_02515 [Elainellaceae cyanobacterium]
MKSFTDATAAIAGRRFACVAIGVTVAGLVTLDRRALAQFDAPAEGIRSQISAPEPIDTPTQEVSPQAEPAAPLPVRPAQDGPTKDRPTQNETGREPATAQLPTCPPGQFPSAFRDVLPTHWAYQAVLNLAAGPARCFDLPPS